MILPFLGAAVLPLLNFAINPRAPGKSPAVVIVVSGVSWYLYNLVAIFSGKTCAQNPPMIEDRGVSFALFAKGGIPRSCPARGFLSASTSQTEQQVPPLRRRWRSGSGRDDRGFYRVYLSG